MMSKFEASTTSTRGRKLNTVCILGGGHGLEASIRAALQIAEEVTAVVSVADDGGSSGRLREMFGLIPPGDMRRCMASFLPNESSMKQIIEYRFQEGEFKDHALGNLIFLAALDVLGSTCRASEFMTELFGVSGRVLPTSEEPLTLCARLQDGREIRGQVHVHLSRDIDQVWVEPASLTAPQETVAAIEGADLVLLGPGSLFTSVLAAAVVPSVREALCRAKGKVVFIGSLKQQPNETLGLTMTEQILAVSRHEIRFDAVVLDNTLISDVRSEEIDQEIVFSELANLTGASHDATLLAKILESTFL